MLKNYLKIVYLSIQNKFFLIFTTPNIKKVLIIFIVGFISRIFINYIYSINIFVDFFNKISITYYFIFSIFIMLVHQVIDYSYITLDVNPCYKPKIKFKISNIYEMNSDDNRVPKGTMFNSSNNNSSTSNYNDRFLSEEELNRLRKSRKETKTLRHREGIKRAKESGRKWGELTRWRKEEKLASNLRWEEEKHLYPTMTHRAWVLNIDGPRMKENILRRERGNLSEMARNNSQEMDIDNSNKNPKFLPSISELPISNPSYDIRTLDRNLHLPPILTNENNTNTNNNLDNTINANINQSNNKDNT